MDNATGSEEWAAPGSQASPNVGPSPVPDAPLTPPPAAPLAPPPVVVSAAPMAAPTPTYRSWQPGIIPLRPVSFGEFLSVPFKAMRYNRAVIIGGPLLCIGVALLLLGAALWLAFTDPSLALTSPQDQLQGIQASTVIVAIAAFLALILADAAASAIVAPGVARAVMGERISVGEAFKAVWSRVGHLLLLWLFTTLAVGLAVAPGFALIVAGAVQGDDAYIGLGYLAMLGLGLLVGLPTYVIAAVARCVIVLERKGAIASIRRTISVIKGRFWWSVLIFFVTGLIISVITGVIQQVLSLVAGIGIAIGVSGAWFALVLGVLVAVFAVAITYVFQYAYMGSVYALVYIDARIRHEGFDLDLARAAEARRA